MSTPRIAAWAAGTATTVAAISLAYLGRHSDPAIVLMSALYSLPFPIGASVALALPDRPLARALLVVGATLPAVSAAGFFWAFGLDMLAVFWRGALMSVAALLLLAAALAWAVRPERRTVLALRGIVLLPVLLFLYELLRDLTGGPFQDLRAPRLFATLLLLTPNAALAVGLRPPPREPPTTF